MYVYENRVDSSEMAAVFHWFKVQERLVAKNPRPGPA